ncbi:MAG: glycosyltransferase [Anaerolineae bacterium]|jgi:glycosyltransferase involved in cell wall biosynthesis
MNDLLDDRTPLIDDSIPAPKVSVLMPCFNVAETIDEAMESLVEQTISEIEIVAVDDGSSDETATLLASWQARDARIRVVPLAHEGIVVALNEGLRFCSAPLIARMDADDRCHPERLEKQAAFLETHEEIAVAGCLVEHFPPDKAREGFRIYTEWLNNLVTADSIANAIFVESPLAHPSVMMRRDWLDRVGGYQDYGWPEDYDLWLRMYLQGAKFAKVTEVLLLWRDHPERLTRTDSRYAVENFLRAKAHYLCQGPLAGRDAVIVWGAGQMGRRLSKHLLREGAALEAFVDIDPRKIGRKRRNRPIIAPKDLPACKAQYKDPIVLAAVGSRGARALIRERLTQMGLEEGKHWWAVA